MQVSVRAERDRLNIVVLHRPGMEMFFGLLEPYASLYERAFSREGAGVEHRRLEEILRHKFNVRVISVRDTITAVADTNPAFRDRLVQHSWERIEFTGYMHDGHFAPGSMKPKVEAAIAFIRSGIRGLLLPGRISGLRRSKDKPGRRSSRIKGSPG